MSELPKKLGKYQIRSVLGQGAMGVVYQGVDPDIKRLVAIKVMHPHLQNSAEGKPFLERFRREAQAAARCNHPNIVTVFELGHDNDCDFIAMEYVQGAELAHFIERGRHFTHAEAIYITGEVLKALDAAHRQGVVHRDIKPANIILLKNGGVKVADFGVARTRQSDLTVSGHMVGTPAYMSPEGLQGDEVDNRADLYSVGMVMLELMTGQKPSAQQRYTQPVEEFLLEIFRAERGKALNPGHRYILHRSLVDDRERRFPDAKAFLDALEKVESGASHQDFSVMDTLARTVGSHGAPAVNNDQPFTWTGELLHKLEKELSGHLGPLAAVLIKKASTVSQSPLELVNTLSRQIKDPKERDAFIEKAKHCMAKGNCSGEATAFSQDGSRVSGTARSGASMAAGRSRVGGAGTVADTLPPEQLASLAKALAKHVGPLAPQLVNRHARRVYAVEDLHQQLAASIPNADERRVFLETVAG